MADNDNRTAKYGEELSTLWNAIVENTKGDLFWIGEILLSELEKETGFHPARIAERERG